MNLNKQRILIVAAHPDDESFGCGGIILKSKDLGSKIYVLTLGEGVSSRFDVSDIDKNQFKKATKKRQEEAYKCLKFLKIDYYKFENRLCTRFDELPILNIVKSIESIIDDFKPSLIFTHNPSEVNLDHRITYQATEIATRPYNKSFIEQIYSYEIPCSGNWVFNKSFNPNTYVEISKYIQKKIQACKIYKNEMRKYPHPRSLEGIKTIAKFRGLQSGLKLAESFKLERSIYI